jgi:hypothetical protein
MDEPKYDISQNFGDAKIRSAQILGTMAPKIFMTASTMHCIYYMLWTAVWYCSHVKVIGGTPAVLKKDIIVLPAEERSMWHEEWNLRLEYYPVDMEIQYQVTLNSQRN